MSALSDSEVFAYVYYALVGLSRCDPVSEKFLHLPLQLIHIFFCKVFDIGCALPAVVVELTHDVVFVAYTCTHSQTA
jgi:hypothetical protein